MRKSGFFRALLFCAVICCMAACCQESSDCPTGSYCIKGAGNCEGDGVCTETPGACDKTYEPVCGCDGNTYGNACKAASAGECVAYEGECKEECEGNENCEEGYYCAKSPGDCEGDGVCTETPGACDKTYEPVCGCDGNTYGNDCEAGAVGVNIAYEGECKEECEGNENCEEGYYCEKSVGDCEGEGVCTAMPAGCPDIWAPVCGCDGNTYGNDCDAGGAGVNIAYEGECKEECEGNENCEKGYYCEKSVGDCEGEGVCMRTPETCKKIYQPVCGCDKKTYSNACEASRVGVSVAYEGECKDIFCPRSKGYWKNHPETWPVDELILGGEIYAKDELLVKLKSPSKGDMELILIKQLIPAKLNKAAGADMNSIDQVIDQADDCLETGDCSRKKLEGLKDKLDRFNNSGDDCYNGGCDNKCDDHCKCVCDCDEVCDDDDDDDDDD